MLGVNPLLVSLFVHAAERRDGYRSLTRPLPFGPLVAVVLIRLAVPPQLVCLLVAEAVKIAS
jgi:hypothetical protein